MQAATHSAMHSGSMEIRAPAEQTEGTRSRVLRWLKTVGEAVSLDEPLIELETDKVTVEVPAPASGLLEAILKHEQEEVAPGDLLGRLATGQRSPVESGAGQPGAGQPTAGQTTAGQPGVGAARAGRQAFDEAPGGHGARPPSPAVRRLLAEHSLDAASVPGTGPGGRITVQDVLFAAARQRTGSVGAVPVANSVPAPNSVSAPNSAATTGHVRESHGVAEPSGRSHRVAHSAVRRRIAEHMVRSLLQTAPHVTTVFEADLSAVLRHRARHRDEFVGEGVPLTLTAYFLRAAVAAIRQVPEVNSRWTQSALEVFDSIHIGIATALENELVVPVLHDLQSLDLRDTARALSALTTRARTGQLVPGDMRGGTFTISNHGVGGSLFAAPIVINQPQSAILGIGKLEKRVVVEEAANPDAAAGAVEAADAEDRRAIQGDRLVIQPRCYVTLTIDHRVLDGHRANRFLQTFVQCLADWPE